MKFRTEIERISTEIKVDHSTHMLMVGSCFTDNIGSRLDYEGFDVVHNPLGPLYNPMSIARCLRRAIVNLPYTAEDLVEGPAGYHCLDYASRYSDKDPVLLLDKINSDFAIISHFLQNQQGLLIVTLGSAYVFERQGIIVGNCHKFPASDFTRRCLSVDEIVDEWTQLIGLLPRHLKCLFTVSPIRHLADGLHGNQISKATLLLATRQLCDTGSEYFPAYEIMLDDLRDYRFYAADMKHPSDTSIDYIYEIFRSTYMTAATCRMADEHLRQYKASQHRQILH